LLKTDQKRKCTRLNKPKIFDLEKLVFYSYWLACLGGDIWIRHALLS